MAERFRCKLGEDEDQLGYECADPCVLAQQMGDCPYNVRAHGATQVWADALDAQQRNAAEKRDEDPYGLNFPDADDLRPDMPWNDV